MSCSSEPQIQEMGMRLAGASARFVPRLLTLNGDVSWSLQSLHFNRVELQEPSRHSKPSYLFFASFLHVILNISLISLSSLSPLYFFNRSFRHRNNNDAFCLLFVAMTLNVSISCTSCGVVAIYSVLILPGVSLFFYHFIHWRFNVFSDVVSFIYF